MTQFTIGADPEIFVRKNGQPLSAYGLVEGTKENPFKTSNGAYQVDGMALEFNIDPSPVDDFDRFNSNIVTTIADLRKAAGNVNLSIVPVQEFDADYLEAQPDAAKELGCDPDYSAYTLKPNPRPDGEVTFRTGAGHIHVGWGADIPIDNEEHIEICAEFVKMLDATVGLFMTFIDREPRRRLLYGKAGAMRPKSYGVEYRTPSNAWIVNRDRRYITHYLVNLAIRKKMGGYSVNNLTGLNESDIQKIIDTGDYAQAQRLVDGFIARSATRREQINTWKKIKTAVTEEFAPSSAEAPTLI